MMAWKMKEKEEYTMEEGVYYAYLRDIADIATKFGEAARFHFVIVNGDFKGKPVSGLVNNELTANSKLCKWITKLLARELEIDEEVDRSDLIGLSARINVILQNNGWYSVTDLITLKDKEKAKLDAVVEKYRDENEKDSDEEPPKKDTTKKAVTKKAPPKAEVEDDDDLSDLDELDDELADEKKEAPKKTAKKKVVEEKTEEDVIDDDDIMKELEDDLENLE